MSYTEWMRDRQTFKDKDKDSVRMCVCVCLCVSVCVLSCKEEDWTLYLEAMKKIHVLSAELSFCPPPFFFPFWVQWSIYFRHNSKSEIIARKHAYGDTDWNPLLRNC